jgi:hypothetical protein
MFTALLDANALVPVALTGAILRGDERDREEPAGRY